MKFAFLGSSDFSAIILKGLVKEGVDIGFTITRSQKPRQRGRKKAPTIVKKVSDRLKIPCIETDNPDEAIPEIKKQKLRGVILASYGAILSKDFLKSIKYPLNIHPSLLPKYRGAAPIQRAIMNGETVTGVTVFLMDEGMDTGDILEQEPVKIVPFEVFTELEARLAEKGAELVLKVIRKIEERKRLKRVKQDHSKATYAKKIKKRELVVDWNREANQVVNQIRALSYKPGAFTCWRGKRLKVLRAIPLKGMGKEPGTVISLRGFIVVSARKNLVCIKEVQPEGKKKMDALAFVNGYKISVGERFTGICADL